MRRFLQDILEKNQRKKLSIQRSLTYYINGVQFFFQDYSKKENVKLGFNLKILKGFEKVLSYIFTHPAWQQNSHNWTQIRMSAKIA